MDRLTAFLDTFKLTASVAESPVQLAGPCLLLVGTDTQRGGRVLLRVQGAGELPPGLRLAVAIEFDNATNPLMAAMPDEVSASLQDGPSLRSTAQALLCEATGDRCGRAGTLNRLAEVMVLREAMEAGANWPGIFAALAHPGSYQAVVSMHDLPARAWTVEDLAALATMSRTHFMTTFHKVAGTTPMAYLTAWRPTRWQWMLCTPHRFHSRTGVGCFRMRRRMRRLSIRRTLAWSAAMTRSNGCTACCRCRRRGGSTAAAPGIWHRPPKRVAVRPATTSSR